MFPQRNFHFNKMFPQRNFHFNKMFRQRKFYFSKMFRQRKFTPIIRPLQGRLSFDKHSINIRPR